MRADTVIGITGIVITTAIAIYAILDARDLVKKSVKMQRDMAYLRLNNDLTWTLVEPIDDVYPSEIAKAFYDLDLFARQLNPKLNSKALKEAVENEALQSAYEMVRTGKFVWKKDVDEEEVKKKLDKWKADKSKVRVARMLGEES